MHIRRNDISRRSHRPLQGALLAGVSMLTLLAAGAPALAAPVLARQTSPVTNATAQAAVGAQQAAVAAQQSMASLTRATQAIQAMQAAQSAARNLALSASSAVPNGLALGGLVPDSGLAGAGTANPVTTWVNANTPTQTTSNGQTTVTIQQTGQQALLNWNSFNVGKNTTIDFIQRDSQGTPQPDWVALNKISPTGVPSQILGSIKADGAVYLINQNGVIFGGSSQVNVHTLIASALDLNDPGYANFLNGNGILANTPTTFQGGVPGASLWVQAGAQISASGGEVVLLAPDIANDGSIATPSGQTILMAGTDATLGAGDSYTRGFKVCPIGDCSWEHGGENLTSVYRSSANPGPISNIGIIQAPQGNITVVGGTVSQNGILTATTSATKNGSVTIRAETGNLTLGAGSVIQILPEASDTSLVTDAQAIANSVITLTAQNIDVKGMVQLHGYDVTNANDQPGGIVITATGTPSAIGQVFLENGSLLDASGTTDAAASASRNSVAVELRTNELADEPVIKSGSLYQQTIYVDASQGARNPNGTIAWQGTQVADASGWIGLITRSLDERLDNGAPITIGGSQVFAGVSVSGQNPASLVQAPGSVINLSGGYLTYTPGFVRVSSLITADEAHVVSVSNADPNMDYAGICCSFTVNHSRWNVKETYAATLIGGGYYDSGYLQGGDAGSLTLTVSSAVLAGELEATTVIGRNQRNPATALNSALGASLVMNGLAPIQPVSPVVQVTGYDADWMTLSDSQAAAAWNTILGSGFAIADDPASQVGLATLLSPAAPSPNSVYLPTSWLNTGLASVSLAANDEIFLPAGNAITLPAGGSFSAVANILNVQSSITAPGGKIALTGAFTTASTYATEPSGVVVAQSGLVTVGAGVALSAAGTWTNDAGASTLSVIAANGGMIALGSYGDIDLGQGSVLDVSGGGYQTAAGKVTGGNGGSLTLAAGLAPSGVSGTATAGLGYVRFDGGLAPGQLKGYGVNSGKGGALSLVSSAVASILSPSRLGTALMLEGPTATDDAGNPYVPLAVSTDFFSSGGFASVSLKAAGISLGSDVALAPTVASLELTNTSAPSQASIAGLAAPIVSPSGIRPAASVSLDATGDLWYRLPSVGAREASVDPLYYGLTIAGTIATDPKGSITLSGEQVAIVSGTVDAPDGTIALSGGTYNKSGVAALNGEGVWLTGSGKLLAAGTAIAVPQGSGVTYYDVLPGGQVTVSGGDVILMPGSLIDVSGSSGPSSLPAAGSVYAPSRPLAPGAVTYASASAGGSITIDAILGGVLEGTLAGRSGGGNSEGGTLSITQEPHGQSSLNDNVTLGGYWPRIEDTFIVLQQSLQPGDADYYSSAQLQPGQYPGGVPVNDANIDVSAQMVAAGGFGSLSLSAPQATYPTTTSHPIGYGFVTFSGSTVLTLPDQLVIKTGTIVVPNGASETLGANYVQWNNTPGSDVGSLATVVSQPEFQLDNTGRLNIVANTVDLVGNLAVQGARTTSFNVAGDLRLTGSMASAGTFPQLSGSLVSAEEIDIAAGQVYPSTDSAFTLASATKIAFTANGAPPAVPLSAGGELSVYAPEIDQSGTLRAPTGTINLGSAAPQSLGGTTIPATVILNLGAGSLTSVSAGGETSLYGDVENGVGWYYNGTQVLAPPAKEINLAATNIAAAPGATIDESGGGDLYAGEFVPGTGGSKNIFSGSNVYAVIPGYSGITPYDPVASAAGPAVGKQVYLNGAPGLPAGIYTLLPGQYAELPGAFLVTVETAAGAGSPTLPQYQFPAVTLADGSAYTFGYSLISGAGTTTDPHWSVYKVMSDAVARRYTEIDNYSASGVVVDGATVVPSFFAAQAAANGTLAPRLPRDAGQLTITVASTAADPGSLTFKGTGNFAPDPSGGLGGIADISAGQILVVDTVTSNAIQAGTASATPYIPGGAQVGGSADPEAWTPVVLAVDDLNRLGVESLLLGGTRSFADSSGTPYTGGVHYTETASQVVVANDASDPLVLPDIQLIASPTMISTTVSDTSGRNPISLNLAKQGTGQVIIAPGAAITAAGTVAPNEASAYVLGTSPTYKDASDYYKDAVTDQFGYVRLSGGGLVTLSGGTDPYGNLPAPSGSSAKAIPDWSAVGGTLTLTMAANAAFQAGQQVQITGNGSDQVMTGTVTSVAGNTLTVAVSSNAGSGGSTVETVVAATSMSNGFTYFLPDFPLAGSVSIGSGAHLAASSSPTVLSASNSLIVFGSGSGRIGQNVAINAQRAVLEANKFSLGAISNNLAATLSSFVLDQAALDSLAGLKALTLESAGTIDLYGTLSLGETDSNGQPVLGNLTFDAAGLVSKAAGTATFTAEQVTFQNSLGGIVGAAPQLGGTLAVDASDVLGTAPGGTATGYNNAEIILGAGNVTLASFGSVDLRSSGQIVATGNGGTLSVQSPLILDAPRLSGGLMTTNAGTPQFDTASYTIAAPGNPIALENSSGTPALPTALLGNSLTITGGTIDIGTDVALPGGTFNATATTGNITVGPQGAIDVSGQAVRFVDVLATIGGGNINLTSNTGAIAIEAGAKLNVGDLADIGALNQTSAGTLSLSAPVGGVTIAPGTLQGQGLSADSGGSFVLDTSMLAPSSAQSYDALASVLVAGGFTKSWDIRARSGDIHMTGFTQARSVTVSADTGNIVIAGIINASAIVGSVASVNGGYTMPSPVPLASGQSITFRDPNNYNNYIVAIVIGYNPTTGILAFLPTATGGTGSGMIARGQIPPGWNVVDSGTPTTGGQISIWAGGNLTLEASAQLDARGDVADANGRGGQVWLGASQAGNQMGTLTLDVGAVIDVGADAPASGVSGPVLGGQVTFSTSRTAGNDGVMLQVNGGSFADFLGRVRGESAWDGITVVGNWVYGNPGNTAPVVITPTSFNTDYLADPATGAAAFMNTVTSSSGIWHQLGACDGGASGTAFCGTLAPGVVSTGASNAALNGGATSQVLVNIRPGIVIVNGGDITIEGDATNWKGIDLSGSAYAGSVLNTGNTQSLDGHFGQYDEPVALAIRAGGNLNFGSYSDPTGAATLSTLSSYLILGSLSDGFSQYTDGQSGNVSLGAGASAWATPFDPAASPAAYNGLSGGLGADSATFFLSAGADLAGANPLAVNSTSTGTMTVAGVPGYTRVTIAGANYTFPVTTDPLYLYNYSWSAGNTSTGLPIDWTSNLGWNGGATATIFADYASLVRTGTGNISIGTAKDLVLQSPLSLIYTAGTGYNVNGTSLQPLQGFTQYNGTLKLAGAQSAATKNADYLPPSTFPTHGGDVTLAIGGNIEGDMNGESIAFSNDHEDLPYDMTALGSQLKLENWIVPTAQTYLNPLIGSFNDIYATDDWMRAIPAAAAHDVYYTLNYATSSGRNKPDTTGSASPVTTGDYQLAWYTWFPYLENTIGSFGGGNISVKAGGNITNVQFVSPTNARDAGPYLVASPYAYNSGLLTNPTRLALGLDSAAQYGGYEGLYVQGGGNITVTAGGNISGVYTYAQNGATSLQAGGSVGSYTGTSASGQSYTIPIVLSTATGDVSVQARGTITIADQLVKPDLGPEQGGSMAGFELSGISLIQNASILTDLVSYNGLGTNVDVKQYLADTVLTDILTSVPTGSVTLNAIGSVSLNISDIYNGYVSSETAWNTNQGLLPAQLHVISLAGDITSGSAGAIGANGTFITYPDPRGTVDLLAQGSVNLTAGFVVSDANPNVMPTLQNIAAYLTNYDGDVTAGNVAQKVVIPSHAFAAPATAPVTTPAYDRLYGRTSAEGNTINTASDLIAIGGANYLAGQNVGQTTTEDQFGTWNTALQPTVLEGDSYMQLLRDITGLSSTGLSGVTTNYTLYVQDVTPTMEAQRHGVRSRTGDPTRIIALTGDVTNGPPPNINNAVHNVLTGFQSFEDVPEATEVYAGRDIVDLALIGQNNNAGDITSVIAGRDVVYPKEMMTDGDLAIPFAIEIGGSGNLLIESGRNVDLGSSAGIQTFGNVLNPNLPKNEGAGITIETGLGSTPFATLDYAAFAAQYVDPATASANPYAEPLVLFDANGKPIGSSADAYNYLQTLSPAGRDILLNRIFFGLVRDSGREYTGAAGGGNYEQGFGLGTVDTAGALNDAYSSYQRAYAVLPTFLAGAGGSGDFLGALSTVRTQNGGNITVMSPDGQILVGQVTPPSDPAQPGSPPGYFRGYSNPTDPTYALSFGIVTEKGGDIDLYANGNIAVNQSRIFTLGGGDMTVISRTANIDAGKGAKTVLTIQPPSVSYDPYGFMTITPYGQSSGSGINVAQSLPGVPPSNLDLISFVGIVNAGDAGIRVSGNLNIAAVQVLNASNIQVQGVATGIPVAAAPNVSALNAASNAAGEAAAAADQSARQARNRPATQDLPSIITVEVIGYGGGDGAPPANRNGAPQEDERRKKGIGKQSYDANSAVQVVGYGGLTARQRQSLTEEEKRRLSQP